MCPSPPFADGCKDQGLCAKTASFAVGSCSFRLPALPASSLGPLPNARRPLCCGLQQLTGRKPVVQHRPEPHPPFLAQTTPAGGPVPLFRVTQAQRCHSRHQLVRPAPSRVFVAAVGAAALEGNASGPGAAPKCPVSLSASRWDLARSSAVLAAAIRGPSALTQTDGSGRVWF